MQDNLSVSQEPGQAELREGGISEAVWSGGGRRWGEWLEE